MSILRFRITFDDFDDIHRDSDFESSNTFADLFLMFLQSISFDTIKTGEFYLADHNLRKGARIGEISGTALEPLNKVELVDHIDDPHQKFLFSYDPEAKWNFNIELIKITGSPEYRVTYPKVASSVGAPPVQYKELLIIPTRERTEPDGRGRKPKLVADEGNALPLFAPLGDDDDDDELGGELADSPSEVSLELPPDLELDLETDSEIAKLAEEFNNTIDVGDESSAADDEELGFSNDDDEYSNGDSEEEDYGSGFGGREDLDE